MEEINFFFITLYLLKENLLTNKVARSPDHRRNPPDANRCSMIWMDA